MKWYLVIWMCVVEKVYNIFVDIVGFYKREE